MHSALHLKDVRTLDSSDGDNSDLAKNLENFLSCFFLSPFSAFIFSTVFIATMKMSGERK